MSTVERDPRRGAARRPRRRCVVAVVAGGRRLRQVLVELVGLLLAAFFLAPYSVMLLDPFGRTTRSSTRRRTPGPATGISRYSRTFSASRRSGPGSDVAR